MGDTHVYVIRRADGSLHKVGESAQGVRIRDGASIRAEQQARVLQRETGEFYTTEIRKNFTEKLMQGPMRHALFRRMWPAAGLMDTKIGCFHLSEVHNAKKEVQRRDNTYSMLDLGRKLKSYTGYDDED
ncbi:hypothetical protein ACWKWJ_07820 [Sphingopyxis terrae subsp. ummariensis]